MKKQRVADISKVDINNTFIEVNGRGWKQPRLLSLQTIYDQIEFPEDAVIKLVSFVDQDVSVNTPPELYLNSDKPLKLSTDGNFLYVWIEDRWKRVALSEF